MSQKLKNGLTPAEMAHDIAMVLIANGWLTNGARDTPYPKDIPLIAKEVMLMEEHLTSAIESFIDK
ncbi:TPA: hypothetical protein LT061_005008 [Salmonella enterica subsp. enterica serovar Blitta]|nr:hypothetical protein [Salmonella enterica subsp. enterica serovar Blitta]